MKKGKLLAKNRKARYNYSIEDEYLAGIVLKGYEVKAIREGKADFEGSYVQVLDENPYVVNMQIGRYSNQSNTVDELDARRSRKLLLSQKEIDELISKISQKGKTAVPLALVLVNNNIKLEFAIVTGKKDYEKKTVAKERQIQKDLAKETKDLGI